jgi:type I restriction enzyme S subunit
LGELCQLDSQLVDPTLPEYESLLHFGPDRIESGTGRLLPANTAAQDALTSVKFYFDSDCILYSKIRPNLNKVALATGPALCSADVYPLTVRPHAATREFLCQLLLSDDFLTYAASLSNRANIPKLNKEQVLAYPALVPPLALQEEFARRVGAVEQLRSAHRDALAKLDELFAALQHRAFRGEL